MRYILQTANASAGGDTNVAETVFHLGDPDLPPDDDVVAQLCAFAQYMSLATGTYIVGVEKGADAPGPTLPQAFPITQYAALQAEDTNIVELTAYGDPIGTGNLAPLGSGIVLSKRSTTPGRTGRGRLTTPWLRTAAVSSAGIGVTANLQFLVDGWQTYIMGDHTTVPDSPSVDLGAYIYPSMSPIVAVSATTRLGRLRSRQA